MNEVRIIVGEHLRTTPDGRLVLRLSGSGPATVTLRSSRPVPPRWLGSARPRPVQFGMRKIDLRPEAVTTVILRLSDDHLALIHRMQSIRATIRVQTREGVRTRRVSLHPPTCRPGGGRSSRACIGARTRADADARPLRSRARGGS